MRRSTEHPCEPVIEESSDFLHLERAKAQAAADPAAFPEAEVLAKAAGIGVTKSC